MRKQKSSWARDLAASVTSHLSDAGLDEPVEGTQASSSIIESPVARAVVPRSAPLAFTKSVLETERLERRLAEYDGSTPVRALDPKLIRPSDLANREDSHYATKTFETLKEAIKASHGNAQAIQVRRLNAAEDGYEYELVYGHRRHRACLDLGIEVRAEIVDSMSDLELFERMTRENLSRHDLSPYELGKHLERGLARNWYHTQEQIAAAYGISPATVSYALAVSRLPREIVDAFASPADIQMVWGSALMKALKEDRAGVMARAASLSSLDDRPTPVAIFNQLVQSDRKPALSEAIRDVRSGKRSARITSKSGKVRVDFGKGMVNDEQLEALEKLVKEFLSRVD